MIAKRCACILILTLSASFGWSASDTTEARLRALVGGDVYQRAGLKKLSSGEQQALLEWLSPATPATTSTPPATAPAAAAPPAATRSTPARTPPVDAVEEFGSEQLQKPVDASVPSVITARIVGEFRGWSGNTIFRLDNGQIWRQRVGGKYRSARRTDPEVQVEKGRFGYYLKVIESGRSVGVKRIR